nr:MAG TPA: hypothetical protein [Inoviridae sp.]
MNIECFVLWQLLSSSTTIRRIRRFVPSFSLQKNLRNVGQLSFCSGLSGRDVVLHILKRVFINCKEPKLFTYLVPNLHTKCSVKIRFQNVENTL